MNIKYADYTDPQVLAIIDAEICRLKNIRQLVNQRNSTIPVFLSLNKNELDKEIAKCCKTPIDPAAIVAAIQQEETE